VEPQQVVPGQAESADRRQVADNAKGGASSSGGATLGVRRFAVLNAGRPGHKPIQAAMFG